MEDSAHTDCSLTESQVVSASGMSLPPGARNRRRGVLEVAVGHDQIDGLGQRRWKAPDPCNATVIGTTLQEVSFRRKSLFTPPKPTPIRQCGRTIVALAQAIVCPQALMQSDR
jgi:hypothetical protein